MGLLTRLLEPKASTPDEFSDFWYGPIGHASAAGVKVNADSSMRVSAVFGCVLAYTNAVSTISLPLYQSLAGGGKQRATHRPLYFVLHDRPNRWQTSQEWRAMMQGHTLLRGNGYSEIIGDAEELIPLHPERVEPELQPDGRILYRVLRNDGTRRTVDQDSMFHLRGLSSDGVKGLSVIELARESVGLSMAAEQYGATSFSKGTAIRGILQHPGKLGEEAAKRLGTSWEQAYGGAANAGKTAVLEEGMTWQQVGMSHEDAQYLEARQYQAADIARFFNVPGVMIGLTDKTATYASAEQFFLSWVTHSVRPWLVNWEQRINASLINPRDRGTYFAEFLMDSLLRADTKTRYEAYQIGRQNGWLNADEIREKENLNPIGGGLGKLYLQQANTVPLGTVPQQALPAARETAELPSVVDGHASLLAEGAASRLIRKAAVAVGKAAVKHADNEDAWKSWVGSFYEKHADEIARTLHVSEDTAKAIAQEQRFAVLHHGVSVMETMEGDWARRLAALALGGE